MHDHYHDMPQSLKDLKEVLINEASSHKRVIEPFEKILTNMMEKFAGFEKITAKGQPELSLEKKKELICEVRRLIREFQAAIKMLHMYTKSVEVDLTTNTELVEESRRLCSSMMKEFDLEDREEIQFGSKWYEFWK